MAQPIRYLTPSKTMYSFGGGANTVQALDPNDITDYYVELGGGNDYARGGGGNDTILGEGGSDTLVGGRGNDAIYGNTINDTMSRKATTGFLYGDSDQVVTVAGYEFGDDTITASSGSANFTSTIYGDAVQISGASSAGDDVLFGGNLAANTIFGDADGIWDNVIAGEDTITGGSGGSNVIYGDAAAIQLANSGSLTSGNDVILGGANAFNELYGDALNFISAAGATITGGNDLITAGDNSIGSTLYGDSRFYTGAAVGGNDTLVSGTGNDTMWGDPSAPSGPGTLTGGADHFRFLADNGADTVMDFDALEGDRIDIRTLGYTDVSELDVTVGISTVIDLGDGNTITLNLYTTALTNSDFIFA